MTRTQLAEVTKGRGFFQRGNDKHDTIRVIEVIEGTAIKINYAAQSSLNARETFHTVWMGAFLDTLQEGGFRTHWTVNA